MGDELAAEELGLDEGWVPADPGGLRPAQGPNVVGEGVEWEDVGAMEFGVEAPDGVDAGGIAKVPEAGDEGEVFGGKLDHGRVVEHAEEFNARGAYKRSSCAHLIGAHCLPKDEDWLRRIDHLRLLGCLSNVPLYDKSCIALLGFLVYC